jgi:Na+/melibiose symporter-like transporter
VFSLLPITFYVLAVALIWTFPITPEVQKRIRRLIERRAARAASRKAQTPAQ